MDFGPAYYFIASTYLVPAGPTIKILMRSIGPAVASSLFPTTTARSARRTAPNATVEEVPSVDQMTEMASKGQGDAFALSHDSFAGLLPKLPGARVLSEISNRHRRGRAKGSSDRIGTRASCWRLQNIRLERRALDAAGFRSASCRRPNAHVLLR